MLFKSFAFFGFLLISLCYPGVSSAATISGTLAFEATPTPDSFVNIWDENGQHAGTAWNDGAGNWVSPDLPAGTYYLTARGEDFGRVSEVYNDHPCPWEACDVTLEGDAIVLGDSDISGIAFDLAPGSWRLRGSLLNGNGDPVGGAVRLFHQQGWPLFDMWADEFGNFESEPLPDGIYFAVSVFTAGMLDEAWDNVPCVNQVCDLTQDGTEIIVDGGDVEGLHFVLGPITSGGHISGTVSGPDGPLANVGIDIFNANGMFLGGQGTDAEGRYETVLLADGTFFVVAQGEHLGMGSELWYEIPCAPWECNDPGFVTGGTSIVISGSDQPDIDFELAAPPGGLISGQLIDDATGLPVPGAGMVLIDADSGAFIQWTGANGNGEYYFTRLGAGDYKVLAEAVPEGYTPELFGGDHWPCDLSACGTAVGIVDETTVLPGTDIYLDFEGTRIVGRITRSDTGEPVNAFAGHVGIDLFNTGGDWLGGWGANEAGLYEIRLEGSGEYFLVAINDFEQHGLINEIWEDLPCIENCYPPEVEGADPVTVNEGESFRADFDLDPGLRISGTLAFEGVPTNESFVNVWNSAGVRVAGAGNPGDGNWETPPLPAGTYYLTARGEDWGRVSEVYHDHACPWEACDVTLGDPVTLIDSDVSGIEFDLALEMRQWRLRGSVRDGAGNPLGGAVHLYNVLGWHLQDMGIDHLGNFESDELADGTYFARTGYTGMLDEAWDDVPCANQVCDLLQEAMPIIVDGGDIGGLDFVLDPITSGGHIGGQVTGPNGPLANVWMEIRNADGEFIDGRHTNVNGYYQTDLFADGTFFVNTQNEPSGLGRELWDDVSCDPFWLCWDPGFIRDNGTPIVISGSDRLDIDFELALPAGGVVSGQLVDAATGLPVMGGWMVLINAETGEFLWGVGADGNGEYFFTGLEPGIYKILADGVPAGYTPELYGGDHWPCDLAGCGAVVNVASDTSVVPGMDIYLDFEGTRIVGRITRSDTGEPVSGAQGHVGVDLFSAGGDFLGGWGANEAGLYDIGLEGGGEYYLLAVNDVEQHHLVNEAWYDRPCVENCYPPMVKGASTVTVNEGETFVAPFELTALAPPDIERRAEVHPTVMVGDGTVIEENVFVRWKAVIGTGAWIEKNADIGARCVIGHLVRIGQNAVLGRWCFIEEGAFVDKGAVLGDGVHVGLYSVVGKDNRIGEGAIIGANVVLGKSVMVHPGVCIPDGAVIPKDAVVDTNLCQ